MTKRKQTTNNDLQNTKSVTYSVLIVLRDSELKKIIYLGFVPSGGHWAKRFFFFKH
jgi:hypothetical protein